MSNFLPVKKPEFEPMMNLFEKVRMKMTARFSHGIRDLQKNWQWSYLPPMMIYFAAGIQGFSGIAGTFFVKEHLDLSAEFLASLAFWSAMPYVIKMPIGHVVDLLWRFKSWLVYLGGVLMAVSFLIFAGLISHLASMNAYASTQTWFVVATLLLPMGFVLQDVVADAMTVEAVPTHDALGQPLSDMVLHAMHTTMQTLGRIAVMSGALFVAVFNMWLFSGVEMLSQAEKSQVYLHVYQGSLAIPLISVLGIWLWRGREKERLAGAITQPNKVLLVGSAIFIAFTVGMGLLPWRYGQEVVFVGSLAILIFLIRSLTTDLAHEAKQTLWATAIVIFMFRAVPSAGEGVTWWAIDVLGYDQHFQAVLSFISYALTLAGLFALRGWAANRSVSSTIVWLSVAQLIIALPNIGMSMGLHEWTARMTGGVIDARFIGIADTALESPLAQIAMIPMLAWIAQTAPQNLKATYFAVMASFTNLALSAAQLGTKYLNQIFVLAREVRDPVTQQITTAANYADLTPTLVWVAGLGLLIPLATIALVRLRGLRSV
jgi:BT1 family